MSCNVLYKYTNYFIASVWMINGLFCKILNMVPRHEQIVAAVLGGSYSRVLTPVIGFAEIVMAAWVLSRFRPRLCAVLQMIAVSAMNVIEFFAAPHLLLWGKLNSLFAALFVALVFYNEFFLREKAEDKR